MAIRPGRSQFPPRAARFLTGAVMEKTVLIRGILSADSRTVRLAPGVEITADAVEIAGELPPVPDDQIVVCVIGTGSPAERERFQEAFDDWIEQAR